MGGRVNPEVGSFLRRWDDLNLTINAAVLTQTPSGTDGNLHKMVASCRAGQRQRMPVKSATNPTERVARGPKLGLDLFADIRTSNARQGNDPRLIRL